MYKVETHNNSRNYFENLIIEKDSIYISANNSISNMIAEVSNVSEKDKWRLLDIENFTNYLYPKWNDSVNRIKLKGILRLFLLNMKNEEYDEETIKEIQFLEDNLEFLFSDFILLFECGVRNLKINSTVIKYELLKKLYKKFITDDYFIECSKEIISNEYLLNIKTIMINNYVKKFKKIDETKSINLEKAIKQEQFKIKKIYFYNLNTIDVKRYLLINNLKSAGYEVIFRIPYFQNLNVINKCWDMIYNNNNVFNIYKNNIYCNSIKENINYLNFLEGHRLSINDKEEIVTKNYREVNDFLNDVKDNVIVTFFKDSLKSCMKRNKLNLKNHCFQTSIGRFIYYLYKCEVDNGTVKLDFNIFRELITSGWIGYKEWNGNRLAAFLVDNEEYFSGVKTIDEIIDRILKIKDADEVQAIFEEQSKNRIKKDKTKAFLSNPLKAFGYLNLEKYNITANYMYVVSLKLKKFILKEFDKSNNILDINEHLESMRLLFKNNMYFIEMWRKGIDQEKSVLKRIYYILSSPNFFGEKLHKQEVSELFFKYLYLGSNSEEQQKSNYSIDQLEGIVLRNKPFANKEQKKICLSDLSYMAYEEHIEEYRIIGKVLSDEEIQEVLKESLTENDKQIALQGFYFKQKSRLAIESYIKFSIANLLINFDGKIEFSWIEGLRKNDNKSIVLKQIESIYKNNINIKQQLEKDDLLDEKEIKLFETYSYDEKRIMKDRRKLPEVAFRDLDFCDQKFLYSSIIQDYPIYYSDFHNKLVFTSLISILKNNIEDWYVNICKYIFPIFPQWEEVIKKNILDCEYARSNIKQYKYFDGINYPKSIDSLYLLKSTYGVNENTKIRNRYNKEEYNGDNYYNEFIKDYLKDDYSSSGKHCMMCPHCYICKRGEFVIDYK